MYNQWLLKISFDLNSMLCISVAVSSGKDLSEDGEPLCMGMSRFCEWDNEDSTTYDGIEFTAGACSPHCKSMCNNYQHSDFKASNTHYSVTYPNGCFKCYGMYPGFFEHFTNDLNGMIQTEYGTCQRCAHGTSYKGPCTVDNVCPAPANPPC